MEKVVNKFFDLSVHRDFARPEQCHKLRALGITDKTAYHWKVSEADIKLHTSNFDYDGYYADACKHIDSVNRYYTTPAYSLADFLVFFYAAKFEFNLIFDGGLFHVFPRDSKIVHDCPPLNGNRLPDVIASVLINLITSGLIDADAFNKFLSDKLLTSVQ